MTTPTELTQSLSKLLSIDTHSLSLDAKKEHLDTLHRLSTDITVLDTARLKSANDLITQESSKIKTATEKLSETNVNDDIYSVVIGTINESLKVVESVFALPF